MIVLIGGAAAVEEVEEVEVEADVVQKHSMYSMVYVQIADVVQRMQPVTVQDIVSSQFDPQEPGVSEGILSGGPSIAVVLIIAVIESLWLVL